MSHKEIAYHLTKFLYHMNNYSYFYGLIKTQKKSKNDVFVIETWDNLQQQDHISRNITSFGFVNFFNHFDPNKVKEHTNLSPVLSPFPFDTRMSQQEPFEYNRVDFLLSTNKNLTFPQHQYIRITENITIRTKKPISTDLKTYLDENPLYLRELGEKVFHVIYTLHKNPHASKKEITDHSSNSSSAERIAEAHLCACVEMLSKFIFKILHQNDKKRPTSPEEIFKEALEIKWLTENQYELLSKLLDIRNRIAHPGEGIYALSLEKKQPLESEQLITIISKIIKAASTGLFINNIESIFSNMPFSDTKIFQPNTSKIANRKKGKISQSAIKKRITDIYKSTLINSAYTGLKDLNTYIDVIKNITSILLKNYNQKNPSSPPKKTTILRELGIFSEAENNQIHQAIQLRNAFSHDGFADETQKLTCILTIKPLFVKFITHIIQNHFDVWENYVFGIDENGTQTRFPIQPYYKILNLSRKQDDTQNKMSIPQQQTPNTNEQPVDKTINTPEVSKPKNKPQPTNKKNNARVIILYPKKITTQSILKRILFPNNTNSNQKN